MIYWRYNKIQYKIKLTLHFKLKSDEGRKDVYGRNEICENEYWEVQKTTKTDDLLEETYWKEIRSKWKSQGGISWLGIDTIYLNHF